MAVVTIDGRMDGEDKFCHNGWTLDREGVNGTCKKRRRGGTNGTIVEVLVETSTHLIPVL